MFQSTSVTQDALLVCVRPQGSKVTAAMELFSRGQPGQVIGVSLSLGLLNPEFFCIREFFHR